MLNTQAHRGEIWSTFLTCGLSKREAGNLYQHFYSLEKCRGGTGLVQVLRARFSALINPTEDIFRRKGDLWRGPFRPLTRLVKVGGRKGLMRALAVLKLTGYYIAPKPKRDDYKAAAKRLSNPDPFFGNRHFPMCSEKRAECDIAYTSFPVSPSIWEASQHVQVKSWMAFPLSWRRSPLGVRQYQPEIETVESEYIDSLEMFPGLVVTHYAYFKHQIGAGIKPFQFYVDLVCQNSKKGVHDTAGGVSLLTKDRGMKLRLIANCNRMLQLACTPLHEYLKQVLHQHEGCYIFSQEDGVKWGVQRLASRVRLSSIDLSSASDNIPLSAQYTFCRNLFRSTPPILMESLHVFVEISRMDWFCPFEGVTITWRNGSPMGVRGSYYLFTLFLINLIDHIGGAGQYAIVGDDIIVESSLTEHILDALSTLHIPISQTKSLFDNELAEFCGRIIDKEGVYRVYKASELSMICDPYGKLRQLGTKALKYFAGYRTLNKRDKQILRYYHWIENQNLWDAVKILDGKPEDPDIPPLGGLSVIQMMKRGDLQLEHYQLVLKLQHALSLRNDDEWQMLTSPITDTGHALQEFLLLNSEFPMADIVMLMFTPLPRQHGYRLIRDTLNAIVSPSQIDNLIFTSNTLKAVERAGMYYKQSRIDYPGKVDLVKYGPESIADLKTSAIDVDTIEPVDSFEEDHFSERMKGYEKHPFSVLRKRVRSVKRAMAASWKVTVHWLTLRWPD